MPSVSVRLDKSQIDDLIAMCDLGAAGLNKIADRLEQMKPTIKRNALNREITEAAGGGPGATAAVRALPGLAAAIRKYNLSANDLLDSIQSGLIGQALDTTLRNWHECRPVITRILLSPPVVLYAKARDLAFDFERVYARARILTDIRPVYDDSRNVIIGANITQTLRIDYFQPESDTKTVTIALDMLDVDQLKKCCEDALQKADVAKQLLEQSGLDVALPGERQQ
jgi:hypothetical protein